jgi:protein subunit release factor B
VSVDIPLNEIELRASRSSGPGGQHANVTASRIEAVFEIDSSGTLTDAQKRRLRARFGPRVTAVAQDSRGQARNRELAPAPQADEADRRRARAPASVQAAALGAQAGTAGAAG